MTWDWTADAEVAAKAAEVELWGRKMLNMAANLIAPQRENHEAEGEVAAQESNRGDPAGGAQLTSTAQSGRVPL